MHYLRKTPQRTNFVRKLFNLRPTIQRARHVPRNLPLRIPAKAKFDAMKWVSATATKNYMLKDPILDWLKLHSKKLVNKKPSYRRLVREALHEKDNDFLNFTPFIMKKGCTFEEKVDALIKKKFPNHIDIGAGYGTARSEEKFRQTKRAIFKGVPIIFSGVLRNQKDQTFGVPDIIIRSDYINKLTSIKSIDNPTFKAPKLKGNYHYLIIDIKFSTLCLTADGIHLLNQNMIPCYKAQTLIYTRALAEIQGYNPQKAFILGRRWKYTSQGEIYTGESCFERLATINFMLKDSQFVSQTDEAIQWQRSVRKDGSKWDPLQMNNPNLFPNMSNSKDFPWTEIKYRICDETKDITKLWMCGTKHRKIAHQKGIYQWSDPCCTPENLGVNGPVTSKVLNKILEINHQSKELISPKKIKNNMKDWQSEYELEFFVDFETINDVVMNDFSNLPISESENLIFEIGVGYIDRRGVWIYKPFIVNDLTDDEEFRICSEFIEYVAKLIELYNFEGTPPFFHWSHAEPNAWEKICEKYNQPNWDLSQGWVDMLKPFKEEPIVIKDVFSFSLKNVVHGMNKHKMINLKWDTACSDGTNAMIAAYRAKLESNTKSIPMEKTSYMKDVTRYNEIDCRAIYEIVKYLRENCI